MKRLLSLTLTFVLILSIFSSCALFPLNSKQSDTKSNTETNTNTESSVENKNEPPKYTNDEYEVSFTFTYKYDKDSNGEMIASLLVDGAYLSEGFEDVIIPDDVVAGDVIKIKVTGGEIVTTEGEVSQTCLHGGEVISYYIDYAGFSSITDNSIPEAMKERYNLVRGNVILDRSGRYAELNEYEGNKLYFVSKKNDTPTNSYQEELILSMFAYDPRNPLDGVPKETLAELRGQKVTIDLDRHMSFNDTLDEYYNGKKYAGYIGYNENGNEYIKYAPSYYSYFLLISCQESIEDAWMLIEEVKYSYEPKDDNETGIDISVIKLQENKIMVVFPSFVSYSEKQEELLNNLSIFNSVEKIEVGYIDTQDNDVRIKGYDIYDVNLRSGDRIIRTYEEFITLFDPSLEYTSHLNAITEETFEENYVLFESDTCFYEYNYQGMEIRDLMVIDGEVYFTVYHNYPRGHLVDAMEHLSSKLIVVPKKALENLAEGDIKINYVDVDLWAPYDASLVEDNNRLDEYPK